MPINPPISIYDRFVIIAPIADELDIEAALSIPFIAPLYAIADTNIPRSQTHVYAGVKATEALRLTINSVEPGFPNCLFEKYDSKNQKTYVIDRLLGLGLTTDPGNI
jgi:hypothetical protein